MLTASAQQEPSFSHYWAMETSFNPAAAGKEKKLNVTGAYAMTLTGFEHAPRTMYIGADMPLMLLNSYHGVGAQLMSDRIGLFDHQRLALQYAYKHRMFGGMLSIGVQLGMLSEKFKGSELDLEEKEDPDSVQRTSQEPPSTCRQACIIHTAIGMQVSLCYEPRPPLLSWETVLF